MASTTNTVVNNNNNITPKYSNFCEGCLHLGKCNSKIGPIWSFSTLPGNEDYPLVLSTGVLLTDIPGTCTKFCASCANDSGCYAFRDAKRFHNVNIKAWAENTLLLRSGHLFTKIDEFLTAREQNPRCKAIEYFRINVAGELTCLEDLENWDNIAAKHPQIIFGIYSKNYDVLGQFIDKHSDTHENFVVNVSQWQGSADKFLAKYPNHPFNVFEYDPTQMKNFDTEYWTTDEINRIAALPHCTAVDAHGHRRKDKDGKDITCYSCKECYKKHNSTRAVYAH